MGGALGSPSGPARGRLVVAPRRRRRRAGGAGESPSASASAASSGSGAARTLPPIGVAWRCAVAPTQTAKRSVSCFFWPSSGCFAATGALGKWAVCPVLEPASCELEMDAPIDFCSSEIRIGGCRNAGKTSRVVTC
jgi:hypothetical protein